MRNGPLNLEVRVHKAIFERNEQYDGFFDHEGRACMEHSMAYKALSMKVLLK